LQQCSKKNIAKLWHQHKLQYIFSCSIWSLRKYPIYKQKLKLLLTDLNAWWLSINSVNLPWYYQVVFVAFRTLVILIAFYLGYENINLMTSW